MIKDIGHTVCNNCGRWWTSLREAFLDGYNCIDEKCSCDYCYEDLRDKEEEDVN